MARHTLAAGSMVLLVCSCGDAFTASSAGAAGAGGGETSQSGATATGGRGGAHAGGAPAGGADRTGESGDAGAGGVSASGGLSVGGAAVAGSSAVGGSSTGGAGGAETTGGAGIGGAGSCLQGWQGSRCDVCSSAPDQTDRTGCANVLICCQQAHTNGPCGCSSPGCSPTISCGFGFNYNSLADQVWNCRCK